MMRMSHGADLIAKDRASRFCGCRWIWLWVKVQCEQLSQRPGLCSVGGAQLAGLRTPFMSAKLGNLLCFVIAASAFAMIGLDATAHHGLTHSGTQEYVRHD